MSAAAVAGNCNSSTAMITTDSCQQQHRPDVQFLGPKCWSRDHTVLLPPKYRCIAESFIISHRLVWRARQQTCRGCQLERPCLGDMQASMSWGQKPTRWQRQYVGPLVTPVWRGQLSVVSDATSSEATLQQDSTRVIMKSWRKGIARQGTPVCCSHCLMHILCQSIKVTT